MTRRLRQLVAPVVLTVALATGAMAQADSVTVVTFGPDGFSLQAPDDVPVGEGRAVLLRRMEGNGWAMTTLKPGDIPSEVVETMGPSVLQVADGAFPRGLRQHRERGAAYTTGRPARDRIRMRTPRLSAEVVDVFEIETQRSVLFEITATLGQLDMNHELVNALSEDDALRRLEVKEDINSGTLEAQFQFESLAAWQAWKSAPETTQMLGALREATGQMRTRMDVRQ